MIKQWLKLFALFLPSALLDAWLFNDNGYMTAAATAAVLATILTTLTMFLKKLAG